MKKLEENGEDLYIRLPIPTEIPLDDNDVDDSDSNSSAFY